MGDETKIGRKQNVVKRDFLFLFRAVKTLAERLSFLMDRKNLGQRPLADLAQVKNTAIHRWVNGLTTNPGKADLEKVAKVLGTTPLWLRTGEGPMTESPLSGLTASDFDRVVEKSKAAAQPAHLNLALLEQVIREVLTQAPGESPERLAQIASEVYGIAQRTRRLDRVTELVRMLLS